jgi:hypothetical protein
MKWTKIGKNKYESEDGRFRVGKNINSNDFTHPWALFESKRGQFVQTIPFIYKVDAMNDATPADWYDKTTDTWRKSRFNAETGHWE